MALRVRPPRRDEAEAVYAVIAARDVADIGRPDYTLDDVLGDWALPEFDFERDAFAAVDDADAIVGYASADWFGVLVAVHPDHEGRGAGTLLRQAAEARMREQGHRIIQQVAAANAAAIEHLRAAGYEHTKVELRLRAALDAVPAPLDAAVRRFDLDAEGRAVHALVEAAFADFGGRVSPYDEWHAEVARRSEPALRLAIDDDDDDGGISAAAVGERWEDGIGFVAQLAVDRRARGRGHGRALLLALFDAFRAAGLEIAELGVHGTNAPATRLYESAGMALHLRFERFELRD